MPAASLTAPAVFAVWETKFGFRRIIFIHAGVQLALAICWKIIEPHLGNKAKRTGRPQADNRKLFNGVLWILRTGAPWRDLPEYYGPWQTVYKHFAQWQENGKLKSLFDQLREGADLQDLSIDGTYIKAHRASAGAKKGTWTTPKTSLLVLVVEDDPPKSMQS